MAWPARSIADCHAILTAPGSRFETEDVVIDGVPTKVWKNGPATLRDLVTNGRAFARRDFLVYEGDRATFEGFHRAVAALAERLAADGVRKGDRVALVMRNLPEWPVAFFAAASLGAIVTPLNAWWTGAELQFGLADSGARIAIVDPERLDRILDHLPDCPAIGRIVRRSSGCTSAGTRARSTMRAFTGSSRSLAPSEPGRPCRTGPCPSRRSRPTIRRPSSIPPGPPAGPRAPWARTEP